MRLRRSTVHTPMRQLLKLEIDTCRVKGQIWTQQDSSIVNATIQHTNDIQTQLQFNNLTRWFTHLISWFTHQISATGTKRSTDSRMSTAAATVLCLPTDASSILAQGH